MNYLYASNDLTVSTYDIETIWNEYEYKLIVWTGN